MCISMAEYNTALTPVHPYQFFRLGCCPCTILRGRKKMQYPVEAGIPEFWGPFHEWFFHRYSNSMANWFWCKSILGHHVAIKFYTCHDSTALVPCAKFHSDHFPTTWMRTEWNFIEFDLPWKNCLWNGLRDTIHPTDRGSNAAMRIPVTQGRKWNSVPITLSLIKQAGIYLAVLL